ncbi:MCE family protein [Nocardioides fonticola]|uniref:MCE family protein n=1 Tax=Nocardioides fonticola TaxID=450363 RepID=A0ABP7XGR2_9ACTN
MSAPTRRALRAVPAIAVAAALTLGAGCDYRGAQSLPLPGAAGAGGYRVSAVFDDVTNLVVKETCRTGDLVVGSVESIELGADMRATVVCRIDPDITLPANAQATLRETSLLGERYVALDPPDGEEPRGRLAPGTVIPLGDTHVVPDVEVVFGALSQVLNGGGLANIETISRELSAAFSGSDAAATTRRIATLVDTLDDHRGDLVAALDSLDRLSGVLSRQRDVIGGALEAVPEGLAVIERQRPALVRMVRRLGALSQTAVPLIARTREATVADLEHLAPVLEKLTTEKRLLARALEGFITFPFPSYTKYVTKGDYAGMYATFNLDLDSLNTLLAQHGAPTVPDLPVKAPATPAPLPQTGLPLVDDVLDAVGDLLGGLGVGSGGLGGLGGLGGVGGLGGLAGLGRTGDGSGAGR